MNEEIQIVSDPKHDKARRLFQPQVCVEQLFPKQTGHPLDPAFNAMCETLLSRDPVAQAVADAEIRDVLCDVCGQPIYSFAGCSRCLEEYGL